MVLNITSSNGEDTTEDSGVFDTDLENYIDSDKSDTPHGPVRANPQLTNLFSTQRGWRVLRLPGARAGDEGPGGLRGFGNFMLQIIPGWRGQTIRDSPFRQMVTARMWQSYLNNMEPIDDALELQASYGPEELLSLRAFCEEWTMDPGHVAFTRRLSNHPSTHASDAILKGNMVYDLCTGQIQLRTSSGIRGESNIPTRLAHDILTSIAFTDYNYYTLNSVHAQEGAQIYNDFLNRYIRLTATEVATIEEIEQGVRATGRAYATMSTNISGDPIEAFALMQQAVEAIDLGDTLTVRANLNALLSPPYNFRSGAQNINVSGPHGGRFVAMNDIHHVGFNEGNLEDSNKQKNATRRMMYSAGRNANGSTVMLDKIVKKSPEGFYMEVEDNGRGVKQVWEFFTMSTKLHARIVTADEQALQVSALIGGFNTTDQARIDARADTGAPDRSAADARRGVRGGPRGARTNPGVLENRWGSSTTMGRGNNYYVEILPKPQIQFKGKQKGSKNAKQYWLQGGLRLHDPTGLSKVLPGGPAPPPKGGYFVKTAIHKRTQTVQPWLVGFPRADFQSFTDSEGRRTIRPKRRKAELDPAWQKFLKFYGVPTYMGGSTGKKNIHNIKKADQGKFYDTLRSKPTKKE
jgi:hypothetical protein